MQDKPVDEITSFSLVDFLYKRNGKNKRICDIAMFLILFWLLPPTLFLSNLELDPHVLAVEAQMNRGETVRKSGLLPAFTRVSYMDPDTPAAFEHYVQVQCGLAPIVLLHDLKHDYLLLNAPERPDRLPEGYAVVQDFGHGLLLLKKVP